MLIMTCGENNEIQVFKFYYLIPVKKYYFFIWNVDEVAIWKQMYK